MPKVRKYFGKKALLLSVVVLTFISSAVSALAEETPTYDTEWVATQMTSGLSAASTNIIHYVGLALVAGLAVFGIVVGIRVALRIFSSVSKGRG